MNIYLVPNTSRASSLEVAGQAADILSDCGLQLFVDQSAAHLLPPASGLVPLPDGQGYRDADIVLTVGGDGTMLHAARYTMSTGKPLLGVNTGRLGFLTSVETGELHKLKRLASGEYQVENRSLLQIEGPSKTFLCSALNDIVLFKESPEKTIALDIYCDDIPVSRFRGDGVVFSTPTGSTAYSMSAGGPILDAALGGIVVTQLCAHIVQMPPMVFAGSRTLRVVSKGAGEENVRIICDGGKNECIHPGETVWIRQAPGTVPLVQFEDAQQLKSIDKKLKGR